MNFEEAIEYMSGLLRFGWKLGNERFEALCERLGSPQDRYPIVHIAGTKGKGSTTALAAGILQAAGYKTGAYFSPYVYDVRERIQINGAMIPKADFARLTTQVRPVMEELAETELGQTTEFELKTVLAFLYFAEQQVDIACLEVGLGGRLDATNVVKPAVTVITNIGLDHTDRLGDTYALIAAEKAGILKPGIPCFTATENQDALKVIVQIAAERAVPLTRVLQNQIGKQRTSSEEKESLEEQNACESFSPHHRAVFWSVPSGQPHTGTVTIVTPAQTYADLEMRMGGVYQRANAACAVAAVEKALAMQGKELSPEAVRQGLARTALPGRLAVIPLKDGPLVVLDGAHNTLAAEALMGPVLALKEQHAIKRILLVFGMMGGHEPAGVLAAFAPYVASVYACQAQWKRAIPVEEIGQAAHQFVRDVREFATVEQAVRAALRDAHPDDLLLITGSFYTVGEVPPEQLEQWAKEER